MKSSLCILIVWALAVIASGLVLAQAPPSQQSASTTLAVNGDIATPLTLKAEDLAAMPRERPRSPNRTGPRSSTRAFRCAKF